MTLKSTTAPTSGGPVVSGPPVPVVQRPPVQVDPPPAPATPLRVEVPIRQTLLSDGIIRYSIPVSVDGSAVFDAQLDTGSTGLRILPDTITSANYTANSVRPEFHRTTGYII